MPWLDRSGRFSLLKASTFALLLLPGVVMAHDYAHGLLGARPVNELIHESGLWALRLLFLSLAITPLRQVLRSSRLILLRRMIGVSAFLYAASHLVAYAADKMFDLTVVGSEIVMRIYLTVGATALVALLALAATSTDGMVRRLGGKRWQTLQRSTYVVALLASVHFFMQSKIDATEPTMMAGFLLWLMGYRVISWYGGTPWAAK
jgi:methionine sulfoxide reductase heme-binding subunit